MVWKLFSLLLVGSISVVDVSEITKFNMSKHPSRISDRPYENNHYITFIYYLFSWPGGAGDNVFGCNEATQIQNLPLMLGIQVPVPQLTTNSH